MQFTKRDFLKLGGLSLAGISAGPACRNSTDKIYYNPFLERNTLEVKTFAGNYFEIGRQQGQIYRQNGMNLDWLKIDPSIYKNQLQIYEKHYPQMLEELRGMAEGGNYDKDKITYWFINCDATCLQEKAGPPKACSIFGVKNKGKLYVGRNYDIFPIAENTFEVYKVVNPERNSFIAVSDMVIYGYFTKEKKYLFYVPEDAINNKGLFIGLTYAFGDQCSWGIFVSHMIKLISETCETVRDALNVFERVPLCWPKNFFIADKNGDMAVVEHTAKRFKVLYPKDDILLQTNHYLDPELKKDDQIYNNTITNTLMRYNTLERYDEIYQKLKAGREHFGFEDIIEILGKPGTHACQNWILIKTIWTLALDMTNQKYRIYWDLLGKRRARELEI